MVWFKSWEQGGPWDLTCWNRALLCSKARANPWICFQTWAGAAEVFSEVFWSPERVGEDLFSSPNSLWEKSISRFAWREQFGMRGRCLLDCFVAYTESLQSLGLHIKPGGQRASLKSQIPPNEANFSSWSSFNTPKPDEKLQTECDHVYLGGVSSSWCTGVAPGGTQTCPTK